MRIVPNTDIPATRPVASLQGPNHVLRTPRSAFIRGFKDSTPAVFGLIPFGMITGAAATAAGMDPWLAMGMSIIVYAGASQLAAISLLTQHAPAFVVVATVLVVNLRFMMYSAAVAPYFRHLSTRKKWLLSYFLVDHNFAMLTSRYPLDHQSVGAASNTDTDTDPDIAIDQAAQSRQHHGDKQHHDAYFMGISCFLWPMWQLTIAFGIFAGTLIPAQWSLDFAIPLIFLALVLPALQSRAHWLTAIVASIAAIFTQAMPMKLGLIVAAIVGVSLGAWLDDRAAKKTAVSI